MLFRKKQAEPSHLVSEKYDTVVWLVCNMDRKQYTKFKSAMDKIYEGCVAMDEIDSIEKELEKEVKNDRN